jgi:hypothetical protein
MKNAMPDQEQELHYQEENDGEIHEPASEAEEAENLVEGNIHSRNQLAIVDQEIKIYQGKSASTK